MNNVNLNLVGLAKSTELTIMTNHVRFAKPTGLTRTRGFHRLRTKILNIDQYTLLEIRTLNTFYSNEVKHG